MPAVLAFAALALTATAAAQNDGRQWIGKKLPTFSLKTTTGQTFNNASMNGKVTLLDFWATWCGPCKAAAPFMQDLHKRYNGQGLQVVGMNAGERTKGAKPATDYAKSHNYTYKFTYEADSVLKSVGTGAYPTFVLLDKQGIVREVWVGYNPSMKSSMEAAIKRYL